MKSAHPEDLEDPEDPPSSLDPAVWSVGTPSPARRSRPWRVVARVVAVLLVLGGAALFVTSLFWGDRSMDLPTGGQIRLGLYRNGWLVHWICGERHDHFSAPFWLASLGLCGAGLIVWRWSRHAAGGRPSRPVNGGSFVQQ